MLALRSLLFNVLFFAWTAVLSITCLPVLALPPGPIIRIGRIWVRGSLALLAAICGLRHQVRGLDNLPDGPCIVAAKHQSAWDTLIFYLLLEAPSYVFKRELLMVPLLGWYLVCSGCIPIDRAGGAGALRRMVRAARRALERGRTVVIFPEGTRVAPGGRRAYHPGTAALYAQLGVPVVPVAVNSGLYWGRRSFVKRPGRISLEVLAPIAPGLGREAFMAELERRIERATERLLGENKAGT